MQQMQLWGFWAIVAAFIVCGCILTRKPKNRQVKRSKKPSPSTLHTADESMNKARRIAANVAKRPELLRNAR
jgi:hypothetical protein